MSMVVYDLEYTTWEGAFERDWSGPGEHREIVQLSAVRLDDDLRETDALEVLIKPRLNPVLSDYFVALTGITQAEVNRCGVDFATAQDRMAGFAGPRAPLYANGCDAEVLSENCRLLSVPKAFASERFHNVRKLIGSMAGKDAVNSCDMAETFNLTLEGRGHTALADARAVAAALRLAHRRGLFT